MMGGGGCERPAGPLFALLASRVRLRCGVSGAAAKAAAPAVARLNRYHMAYC